MSSSNADGVEITRKNLGRAFSLGLARLLSRTRAGNLTLLDRCRRWSAAYYDARLNIRTASVDDKDTVDNGFSASLHGDGVEYESPDYRNLRRVFKVLDLGPEDVFYDLGSGKGRVLCLAARHSIRKAVGIEINPNYCLVARRNAASLRSRRARIDLLCADACRAPLNEGTVYFMYNAFGPDTLNDVLDNLKSSLKEHPRPIRLIYYNAVHADLLGQRTWLEQYDSFRTLTGRQVAFWRTTAG